MKYKHNHVESREYLCAQAYRQSHNAGLSRAFLAELHERAMRGRYPQYESHIAQVGRVIRS